MLVAATQMSRPTGHVPFVEQVMQVCFEILVLPDSIFRRNIVSFYGKRGIPFCRFRIWCFFCSFLMPKRGMTDMWTIVVPAMEMVGLFYAAPSRLFSAVRGYSSNVSFAGFSFRLKPSISEDFSFPHRPEAEVECPTVTFSEIWKN
jgi:hypothetical protein